MRSAKKMFLKVSPWKKVMRFGKNGKLSPRFIGSYEVIEKVGLVVYRLALLQSWKGSIMSSMCQC